MDKDKQDRLKDAGWKIGSADEFLSGFPENCKTPEQKESIQFIWDQFRNMLENMDVEDAPLSSLQRLFVQTLAFDCMDKVAAKLCDDEFLNGPMADWHSLVVPEESDE